MHNTYLWRGGGITGNLSVGGVITGKLDGAARYLTSPDTRSVVINPSDITASENGVRFDFKASSTIGLSSSPAYSGVMTYRPYSHNSDWTGGPAHQLAFNANGVHWRKSSGDTTWSSWYELLNTSTGLYAKVYSPGSWTSVTITYSNSVNSGIALICSMPNVAWTKQHIFALTGYNYSSGDSIHYSKIAGVDYTFTKVSQGNYKLTTSSAQGGIFFILNLGGRMPDSVTFS